VQRIGVKVQERKIPGGNWSDTMKGSHKKILENSRHKRTKTGVRTQDHRIGRLRMMEVARIMVLDLPGQVPVAMGMLLADTTKRGGRRIAMIHRRKEISVPLMVVTSGGRIVVHIRKS